MRSRNMKPITLAAMFLLAAMCGHAQDDSANEWNDHARLLLIEELQTIVERKDLTSPVDAVRLERLTDRLANKYGEHVVRRGDTVSAIAMRYETTVREIQTLNPELKKDPRNLFVGQVIRIRK